MKYELIGLLLFFLGYSVMLVVHYKSTSFYTTLNRVPSDHYPTQWGVITTILEINEAVKYYVQTFPHHYLVVIGDQKTNHLEWDSFASRHQNVFYLSPSKQINLKYSILNHIPWNHFGRKSIGYLFAISHGATQIYDFDDDNHLSSAQAFSNLATMEKRGVRTTKHVFNPYPFFEPETSENKKIFIWPRGFPQQWINENTTSKVSTFKRSESEVVVIQSLADHDPDVDAIYRMTRPLPVYFRKKRTMLVMPPRGTFTPWNAQAVLVNSKAYWGLLLPITVTGRVSDIWRSYITSRLLWETNYTIGFASPFVTQYRNPHSYMEDFEAEDDLYHKTDEMLAILSGWNSNRFQTLEEAYLDLIKLLVLKKMLKSKDFSLAQAWCSDLRNIHYKWPLITHHSRPFVPKIRPIVDQRHVRRYPSLSSNQTRLSVTSTTSSMN